MKLSQSPSQAQPTHPVLKILGACVVLTVLTACQTVEVSVPYNAYRLSADSSDGSVLYDHELLAAGGVSQESAIKQAQLCAARSASRLGFTDVIFVDNPLVHKEGTWSPARYRVRLKARYLKTSTGGSGSATTMANSLTAETGLTCPN